MDNLLFLQFLQQSDQKDRTLKQTKNPFDDFDKAEFKCGSAGENYRQDVTWGGRQTRWLANYTEVVILYKKTSYFV